MRPQLFGGQRAIDLGQRVVRGDHVHKRHLTQVRVVNRTANQDGFLRDTDGKVSQAFVQDIHRAGQCLVQNA